MTDSSVAPRLSALAALQYRDFAVYASARFCATLAWQILGAAVGYQIYQLTRDPLALAFVGAAQFAPFVLCVLPAGQIADRFDRRLVLICAYSVEALCAAALLWFTLSGLKIVWPMFIAMAFFGAGRAFWMPAGQAITPNLVPREAFPSAVAVNSTLFQSGVIIGPALSGVLLYWGPQAAYITVVALLIAVVALMITIQPVRGNIKPQPFRFGDLLGGSALRVSASHGAGRDFAGSVRRAVRWRDGDDADLRQAMCCMWARSVTASCERRPASVRL